MDKDMSAGGPIDFTHVHAPRLRVVLPSRWCVGRDVERDLLMLTHLAEETLTPTVVVSFTQREVSATVSTEQYIAAFYARYTGVKSFNPAWIEPGSIGGIDAPRIDWTDGVRDLATWFVRQRDDRMIEVDAIAFPDNDGNPTNPAELARPLVANIAWL